MTPEQLVNTLVTGLVAGPRDTIVIRLASSSDTETLQRAYAHAKSLYPRNTVVVTQIEGFAAVRRDPQEPAWPDPDARPTYDTEREWAAKGVRR